MEGNGRQLHYSLLCGKIWHPTVKCAHIKTGIRSNKIIINYDRHKHMNQNMIYRHKSKE